MQEQHQIQKYLDGERAITRAARIFIAMIAGVFLFVGVAIGIGIGLANAATVAVPMTQVSDGKDQSPDVVVGDLTRVDPGEAWLNVEFKNPVSGEVILTSDLKVDGLDIAAFGNDKLNANDYTKAARASAATALKDNVSPVLSDAIIEGLGDTYTLDESGNIVEIPFTINVAIQIKATGAGTDALERSLKGDTQVDGTVLWGTRQRLAVDGLDWTALDPSTSTLAAILGDITANVEAEYNG